jgi:hypothetical protein
VYGQPVDFAPLVTNKKKTALTDSKPSSCTSGYLTLHSPMHAKEQQHSAARSGASATKRHLTKQQLAQTDLHSTSVANNMSCSGLTALRWQRRLHSWPHRCANNHSGRACEHGDDGVTMHATGTSVKLQQMHCNRATLLHGMQRASLQQLKQNRCMQINHGHHRRQKMRCHVAAPDAHTTYATNTQTAAPAPLHTAPTNCSPARPLCSVEQQ